MSLSDEGLVQVLEASVTGLDLGKPYVLALSEPGVGRRRFAAATGLHD